MVELRFVTTFVTFTAAARTLGVSVGAVPDGSEYEFFGLNETFIKIRFMSFELCAISNLSEAYVICFAQADEVSNYFILIGGHSDAINSTT
ncbi:hypothetical protein BKM15_07100 [Pseudomonas syringae pv. syringae]|nr:hypothetical protein BKM15_07100 [Pseudomonas syringae pv. syringae]